ncbi:hypothetical protein JVU11DRAFT_8448 [Chiua virens]|nr:hypothetical protein JVU11DRAFT_8448 [Chiua virens]
MPQDDQISCYQLSQNTTELVVRHLHARLKTDAFNGFHDKLSVSLSANNARTARQILLRLYDLGSLIGLVGMLLGFALLFFTVASLSSDILHAGRIHSITKRATDYTEDSIRPASDGLRINPIIPGLTVPLSHLPLILIALSISQIFHEAGHAITAALHRIPMLSCGFAVTFLLPSAFVVLPVARLDKLPPRDRLQIISAGCFHNFMLSCLLFFAAWLGAGSLPTWILFQDISALGRLVVGVDYDSPLATHLPVGTLIIEIDGFSLASDSLDDPWDHYLLSPSSGSMQGWCVDDSLLNKSLVSSCTTVGSHACFVSKADETIQYELDPVHIFTDNLARCDSVMTCVSSSCVVPRRDQELVRISVLRDYASARMEDMIVWKGPKEEIWEQVQVSKLRPRFPFVSIKLPEIASAFFECVGSIMSPCKRPIDKAS